MKECKLFVKSYKPGTNGLISWNDDGKIIIARNTGDTKPGYFDYSIVANKERCTIVELGDRHVEDLYHNIMIENRKEIIAKLENYHDCGKNIIEIMNQLLYYLKNKMVDYYINNVGIEYLYKTEELLQFINE